MQWKRHQCNVCKNLFSNNSVMIVQKRIHFDDLPCKCVDCGDRFSCKSILKSPNKMYKHQNENDYTIYDFADLFI